MSPWTQAVQVLEAALTGSIMREAPWSAAA